MLYTRETWPPVRDRVLESRNAILPHPSQLTTPQGHTPFGTMKTPSYRVMLYAAIMFPDFIPAMFELIDPERLNQQDYAIYEAITVAFESGSIDVVQIFRYVRENHPGCKYRMLSDLLDERDFWNLHEETIENVIRQYRPA